MTMLFMDSFDHYGTGAAADARMLDGVWAQIDTRDGQAGDYDGLQIPSFGARTGNVAMFVGRSATYRLVLPSAQTVLYMGVAVYFPSLPTSNGDSYISFRDSGNTRLMSLMFNTDGSLSLVNGNSVGSPIVSSNGPVITAGTWHHLEMKLVVSATVGTFEVRRNGSSSAVIDGSGLNTIGTDIAQLAFEQSIADANPTWWIDDLVIFNNSGSYNNDFIGDVRVTTLVPNADDALNWTNRPRLKLGNGVADLFTGTDAAISAADSTEFEFGSGSFTVEGFVRFHSTSAVTRQIVGKWQTDGNREWTLELTGDTDTNPNQLRWLVSTDGSAETIVHSWPFVPLLYKYYHFAVVRDTTDSYLFLDGVQLGITRTDSATYNAGPAALAIGARMSSATAVVATTGIDGIMDEVRITKGVARYTSNFTPTTVEFGRDVGGDASFASVSLLAGFNDSAITDESGTGHTLTARNSAAAILPDDGAGGYDSLNQLTPRDDTVVEAALLAAYGVLTLGANPSNNETVTVGSQTYTFKTTLSGSADEVLIGAATADSLSNLEAAINGGSGAGTTYGTGTTANTSAYAVTLLDPQLMIVALTAGTAGNSIATTETLGSGSFDDTTLNNGANIPSASDFSLSRLPPSTTQVKAIQVMTRSFKTDAGTATIKSTLVGPSAATAAGAAKTLTTDPTYNWDIFEEDPDTSAAITPVTVANGKVRIDRTA